MSNAAVTVDVRPYHQLAWHTMPDNDAVLKELETSVTGLSSDAAAKRLTQYGPNALTPPKKPGFLAKLWGQLNNVLVIILLAACVVVAGLQQWIEMGLILAVVVINVLVGMVQEGKAEKAAEAIKAMLSSTANVIRDGKRFSIDADKLVPGDVVAIKSGDRIPADLRLLETTNLQVQEAMLTGESVPVSKNIAPVPKASGLGDRRCMAYSCTSVSAGQGLGVVVATGDFAEIGKINQLVSQVDSGKTNLVIQVEILGRWIAVIVVAIAFGAFMLAHFYVKDSFKDAFESAVAIAVAMIPNGLPSLMTIVLALGTKKMAKHNAIIRQLPCVETLGSLTVICSDKTGTLTKNEMTVVALFSATGQYDVSGVGYAPDGGFNKGGQELSGEQLSGVQALLEGTILCNDSHLNCSAGADGKASYTPNGAPTEVSLITAGLKAGLDVEGLRQSKPRLASVPFESEHKFMATVHQVPSTAAAAAGSAGGSSGPGRRVLYVKGAPDRLLPMCCSQLRNDSISAGSSSKLAPVDPGYWMKAQEQLSSQGLRVLALCSAELAEDEQLDSLSPMSLLQRRPFLTMLALVAILDPPRPEAIEAVKVAHEAGITVKMITGDHALTGLAIGKILGISGDDTVITGPQVDAMDDAQLAQLVDGCNIYARASPENKLRIVRALQAGPGHLGILDGDDEDDDGPPVSPRGTIGNRSRHVVAMTGDGVNDAPALKAADIGVAMGITGTDVSREAAKMVLADDNFASIVVAVREGRRVWDNLRKILLFNLPVNFAQGTCIFWAFVLGFTVSPLGAIQVLYVNLVSAVTMGMMLAAEPAESDIMTRAPRRPGKRLLGKLVLWRCLFVTNLIVILVLGMYFWALSEGRSLAQASAEAFNTLVFAEIGYSITTRFIKVSTFHPRVLKGNPWCYLSIALTAGLQVMLTYVPGLNAFFSMEDGMAAIQWARVIACMVVVYVIVEAEKALVDPLLMPMIRPVLTFIEGHSPAWLSNPVQLIPEAINKKQGKGKGDGSESCGTDLGTVSMPESSLATTSRA